MSDGAKLVQFKIKLNGYLDLSKGELTAVVDLEDPRKKELVKASFALT